MMQRMERRMIAILVLGILSVPGVAAAQNRWIQVTPDGKRVLTNKDVGNERWAISRNEDGTATGNVFRSDGGDPAFIFCSPLATPNAFECVGADGCTEASGAQRGIQGTPDGKRVLVQKDVGAERWAISLNLDDGTATGNVFFANGGEPVFIACEPTGAPNRFACSGADKCQAAPCSDQFVPISEVTLPASFFAVPDPCVETYTPLGTVTLPPTFFVPPTRITFRLTVSAPIQGFDVRVSYPVEKGTFEGSGEGVACTTTSGGYFLAGDLDADGTLVLLIANTGTLTFPIDVQCGFSEIAPVAASDFTVVVKEVTQDLWPGDPSVLTVAVDVD